MTSTLTNPPHAESKQQLRVCLQLPTDAEAKLTQVKEHLASYGFDRREDSRALRAALLAVTLDDKLVQAAEADAENDQRLRYSKKVTKSP